MEERGFEITYLDVDEQGFIKPEKLLQALRKDTILVSIMTANNEIGTIQAIPERAYSCFYVVAEQEGTDASN